jgi:hypothetical protein
MELKGAENAHLSLPRPPLNVILSRSRSAGGPLRLTWSRAIGIARMPAAFCWPRKTQGMGKPIRLPHF